VVFCRSIHVLPSVVSNRMLKLSLRTKLSDSFPLVVRHSSHVLAMEERRG